MIEGENRNGPIRDEYRKVMEETETLERPYSRQLLIEAFELAGLSHYEFLGAVNGLFSLDDPRTLRLADIARTTVRTGISLFVRRLSRRCFAFVHGGSKVTAPFALDRAFMPTRAVVGTGPARLDSWSQQGGLRT